MAGEIHRISDGCVRVEYPDKAYTHGVGPCLAIGIFNRESKVGYLGHYYSPVIKFVALLEQAKNEAKILDNLEVVLVGTVPPSRRDFDLAKSTELLSGSTEFQECIEDVLLERESVRNIMQLSGIPANQVKDLLKNEPGDYDYTMMVDTEKGNILTKKEED